MRFNRFALAAVVLASTTSTALAAAPSADARTSTSYKVLPYLTDVAGAVDAAGGSLVAGVADVVTGTGRGFYLYHRDPSGRWGSRVKIPLGADVDPYDIQGVQVTGGPTAGFFVITWLYSVITDPDDPDDPPTFSPPKVYSVTRLPSGTVTAPKLVLEPDTPYGLQMSGNANGDAAVTTDTGNKVARYVRGVGWTSYTVPAEAGDGERGGAAAMISPARTVDVTYTWPRYVFAPEGRANVVQQTLPDGASEFTRRVVYTAPDGDEPDFDIAMDSAGLQTLVTDDEDDGIKVYRESTRRGPFEYQWRKPNEYRTQEYEGPQVESRGRYTRVTWTHRTRLLANTRYSRSFNGTNWSPSAKGASFRSQLQPFHLAIASDGTGVEVGGVQRDVGGRTRDYLLRGVLGRTSRSDTLDEAEYLSDLGADSNADGVSQTVDTDDLTIDHTLKQRTVARIRR